jgi:hypothetical protein
MTTLKQVPELSFAMAIHIAGTIECEKERRLFLPGETNLYKTGLPRWSMNLIM